MMRAWHCVEASALQGKGYASVHLYNAIKDRASCEQKDNERNPQKELKDYLEADLVNSNYIIQWWGVCAFSTIIMLPFLISLGPCLRVSNTLMNGTQLSHHPRLFCCFRAGVLLRWFDRDTVLKSVVSWNIWGIAAAERLIQVWYH